MSMIERNVTNPGNSAAKPMEETHAEQMTESARQAFYRISALTVKVSKISMSLTGIGSPERVEDASPSPNLANMLACIHSALTDLEAEIGGL